MPPENGDDAPTPEPTDPSAWTLERVEEPASVDATELPEEHETDDIEVPTRRFAALGARVAGVRTKAAPVLRVFPRLRLGVNARFVAGFVIGSLATYSFVSGGGSSNSVPAPVATQLAQLQSEMATLRAGAHVPSVSAPTVPTTTAVTETTATTPVSVCDSGRKQSPIALETTDAPRLAGESQFQYEAHSVSVKNIGHGFVIDAGGAGALHDGDHTYRLDHIEVRAPGEHTVDGQQYPVELQLVHKDTDGKTIVVSVMVESGPALDGFDAVLAAIGDVGVERAVPGAFDPTTLLPPRHDAFVYDGSLTTPPCTEGVEWLVLVDPISMSDAQITTLKSRLGGPNNRSLQPTNGRTPKLEVDLAN